jgi:peptidoglycan hydrolase-like protein with peptidoglycan-binding domain
VIVICRSLAVMVVLLTVARAMPAGAQAAAWTPPLGPDGHPDLQGVWLNNSATPLERPQALAGRTTLTDEEVATLRTRAARLLADPDNDFSAADGFFLAALADASKIDAPASTGTTGEMIEREFDNRTSLISDPPDGRIPPLTPEGQRLRAASAAARRATVEGPEAFNHVERCLTYGVPRLSGTTNAAGAGPLGYYQIVQTPSAVMLFFEAIHEARVIHLTGTHPPAFVGFWMGDSRGRWDGQTLVVDTTNFTPRNDFMGSSDRLHLVERFTRVSPDRLDYQITIEDPTLWTRPWTVIVRLRPNHEHLYEYACHEGNTEIIANMLAGARASGR